MEKKHWILVFLLGFFLIFNVLAGLYLYGDRLGISLPLFFTPKQTEIKSEVKGIKVFFNDKPAFDYYLEKAGFWDKGPILYGLGKRGEPKKLVIKLTDEPQDHQQVVHPSDLEKVIYSLGYEWKENKKEFVLIVQLGEEIWDEHKEDQLLREIDTSVIKGLLFFSKEPGELKDKPVTDEDVRTLNEVSQREKRIFRIERQKSFWQKIISPAHAAVVGPPQADCNLITCSGSTRCCTWKNVCQCSAGGGTCIYGLACSDPDTGIEGFCICTTECSDICDTMNCTAGANTCYTNCETCEPDKCNTTWDCSGAPAPGPTPTPSPGQTWCCDRAGGSCAMRNIPDCYNGILNCDPCTASPPVPSPSPPPAAIKPEVLSLTPNNRTVEKGQTISFTTTFRDQSRQPGNNLLQNGSFESGLNNWTFKNMDYVPPSLRKRFGNNGLQCSDNASAGGRGSFYQGMAVSSIPGGISANDRFTVSLWVMALNTTRSGTLALWKIGGDAATGEDHVDFTVSPSEGWKLIVLRPTIYRTDRTELRVEVFLDSSTPDYVFDGIMLEKGVTQAAFTDIDTIQLNIENEDDNTYSPSRWPLRMMFKKDAYDGEKYRFYLFDGSEYNYGCNEGNNYCCGDGVEAGYTSSGQKWYLPDDIDRPYGTLKGGADNTYFTISTDNQATAYWTLTLNPDFPVPELYENSNLTLYVEDDGDSQDDTATNPLFLNNTWTFHRLGTLTATPATGTIIGNVYGGCECSGTADPPNGWTAALICASGSDCSGVSETFTANSYTFENVPYNETNQYGVSIDPPGDHQVICVSATQYGYVRTGSDPLNLEDAYLCEEQDAWWQASGGSIHAEGNVDSDIPSSALNPYLITGTNGALSYSGSYDLGEGSLGQTNSWRANSSYLGAVYNYSWWQRHLLEEEQSEFGGGNLSGQSGIVNLTGSMISGEVNAGQKLVILRDGDMTLSDNITVAPGGFLMVVVSGRLTIDYAVDEVEGIFIADEVVITTGGTESDSDLEFRGSLIGWDSISLSRDIGGVGSVLHPSITFIYRPDFVINAPDFLKRPFYTWEQVPG